MRTFSDSDRPTSPASSADSDFFLVSLDAVSLPSQQSSHAGESLISLSSDEEDSDEEETETESEDDYEIILVAAPVASSAHVAASPSPRAIVPVPILAPSSVVPVGSDISADSESARRDVARLRRQQYRRRRAERRRAEAEAADVKSNNRQGTLSSSAARSLIDASDSESDEEKRNRDAARVRRQQYRRRRAERRRAEAADADAADAAPDGTNNYPGTTASVSAKSLIDASDSDSSDDLAAKMDALRLDRQRRRHRRAARRAAERAALELIKKEVKAVPTSTDLVDVENNVDTNTTRTGRQIRRARYRRRRAERIKAAVALEDASSDSEDTSNSDSDDASSSASDVTQRPSHPSSHQVVPGRATPAPHAQTSNSSGSVMSASDAKTSIDSFFADSEAFMADKENKLRLWQSLCIEFGVVDLERSSLPDLPVASSPSSVLSPSSSRSATPRPTLPPFPTSLTQARLVLKTYAHVNLCEYVAARDDPARHEEPGPADIGKYADLLYPSAAAVMRATRRAGTFYPLAETKMQWLEPLLKDFGFHRRR